MPNVNTLLDDLFRTLEFHNADRRTATAHLLAVLASLLKYSSNDPTIVAHNVNLTINTLKSIVEGSNENPNPITPDRAHAD